MRRCGVGFRAESAGSRDSRMRRCEAESFDRVFDGEGDESDSESGGWSKRVYGDSRSVQAL